MLPRVLAFALLSILVHAGCDSQADLQAPVVMGSGDDAAMAAAERKARDTVDEFITALENPRPEQQAFAVKARFEDGEQSEYMWLSNIQLIDGKFVGAIDNEPQLISNIEIGDRKTVDPGEISDWMILVDNGEVTGGYTIEVLEKRQQQTP